MWTVIYMTKDEIDISLIKNKLKENDIMSMIRKRDEYFEVLVPEGEVGIAHNVIIETEI